MLSNHNLIKTINNNEIYEKLRPLDKLKNTFRERQAHGDDTQDLSSKDQVSNEFSFEMAMQVTDTSNEALKTDDENGMTKSYYHQQGMLSDVSLPQNECEYEIDLGNGYITKSILSYQKQQRTTSILSADSIQPITTFKIPFTNTIYKPQMNPKEEIRTHYLDEIEQHRPKFSLRTITIFSLGTMTIIFLVVILFFVF
jgi:hypothetical protein